jgi:hypothetical protein
MNDPMDTTRLQTLVVSAMTVLLAGLIWLTFGA